MGIRFKLFVPMLLLIVAMGLLVHFYWLPGFRNIAHKSQVGKEVQYIQMLATALTPALLANDVAEVHATLEKVLQDREHWRALTVYNASEIRIFPLTPPAAAGNGNFPEFRHTITQKGVTIGLLSVQADIDSLLAPIEQQIASLERLMFYLVLAFSAAATLLQDRWIRTPLHQLMGFAESLARGRYAAAVPHDSSDELGKLAKSLTEMRDEIRKRENELNQAYSDLESANAKLEQISHTDAVTGIANRRMFDHALSREISRSIRQRSPLALILCDVDAFKNYNDTYGHQQGDRCLRQIAAAIKGVFMRGEDTVTRYGGEEFAIVLPNVDAAGVRALAEKMRAAAADLAIPHSSSPVAPHVTVSAGFTVMEPGEDMTMSELIERADRALYQAKSDGRNTVRMG